MTNGSTQNPNANPTTHPIAVLDLLSHVCHLERRRSRELLHEVGLYRGRHAILSQLWHEDGVRQRDLVHHSHVKAAAISKTLFDLEEEGLVTRSRDEVDRRVMRVYLTDAGRALKETASDIRPRLAEEALAGFDDETLSALGAALAAVAENLQSVVEPRDERHHRGHRRERPPRSRGSRRKTRRLPGGDEEAR